MLFWRIRVSPRSGIYDWLLANKQEIIGGTADYMGTPVADTTEFYQYRYVISCGVGTLQVSTEHFLPTHANHHLRFTAWKYSLITLLLGWWCFPWGPPFVLYALFFNLTGGGKCTAASLLQLVEWGWSAPRDAAASPHRKSILTVSASAAEEIRSRMQTGGYSEGLAVRVTPTRWGDSEVEIAFDYPVSDGRDLLDSSEGLILLIDQRDEATLSGCRVEFADGTFYATTAPAATSIASD